jgi:archaellum component FlaC
MGQMVCGVGKEQWRALGPWRDTEAEAKNDAQAAEKLRELEAKNAGLPAQNDQLNAELDAAIEASSDASKLLMEWNSRWADLIKDVAMSAVAAEDLEQALKDESHRKGVLKNYATRGVSELALQNAAIRAELAAKDVRIAELEYERDELDARAELFRAQTSWLLDSITDNEVYPGDRDKWQERRAEIGSHLEFDFTSHRDEEETKTRQIAAKNQQIAETESQIRRLEKLFAIVSSEQNELQKHLEEQRNQALDRVEMVEAERNELQRRIDILIGEGHDPGNSAVETITALREELSLSRALVNELRPLRALVNIPSERKRIESLEEELSKAKLELKSATSWRDGVPSEPGLYAVRDTGVVFLGLPSEGYAHCVARSDGRLWNIWTTGVRQYLPIRLDDPAR